MGGDLASARVGDTGGRRRGGLLSRADAMGRTHTHTERGKFWRVMNEYHAAQAVPPASVSDAPALARRHASRPLHWQAIARGLAQRTRERTHYEDVL
jgi:hypothetical protein